MASSKGNGIFVLWGSVVALIAAGLVYWAFHAQRELEQAGPTWSEHEQELKKLEGEIKGLVASIKEKHGRGTCKFDGECRVVGLGAKTCEGYNDFLIYSTLDTNEAELLSLVTRLNLASEKFNDRSLKVPPCGKQPAPIRCLKERCTPKLD